MERLEDFRAWFRRKVCRHRGAHEYEEVRLEGLDGKRSWSAFFVCGLCGEVLDVEASYYGTPERVLEAVSEECGVPGERSGGGEAG